MLKNEIDETFAQNIINDKITIYLSAIFFALLQDLNQHLLYKLMQVSRALEQIHGRTNCLASSLLHFTKQKRENKHCDQIRLSVSRDENLIELNILVNVDLVEVADFLHA